MECGLPSPPRSFASLICCRVWGFEAWRGVSHGMTIPGHLLTTGYVRLPVMRTVDRDLSCENASPADQRWADLADRRCGATAEDAVDALIREVLDRKQPDEIFPELSATF